LPRKMAYSK